LRWRHRVQLHGDTARPIPGARVTHLCWPGRKIQAFDLLLSISGPVELKVILEVVAEGAQHGFPSGGHRPAESRHSKLLESRVPLLPYTQLIGNERNDRRRFMASTHVKILDVFPFHESQGAAGILLAEESEISSADETSAAPCWWHCLTRSMFMLGRSRWGYVVDG
jgi:hypothetical protein